MTALRFVLAVCAFVAFHTLISILWNMVMFKKLYEKLTEKVAREKPIVWFGFLAITVIAVIMAFFISTFAAGINPIMEGLKYGLLIGSIGIIGSLTVPARFNIKPAGQFAITEFVYWAFQYAFGGMIMALILL